MSELYIGLMSGTSADGINAVLVEFQPSQPKMIANYYQEYSDELRRDILSLCQPGSDEINRLADLDVKLGKIFAEIVKVLLKKESISPKKIRAIGSHGQTIRHYPNKCFTLQIGDPNIIAAETGITTVADFRRRDIAVGGQGAPLVPAFHQAVFAKKDENRAIVNIGGIANITLLSTHDKTLGFDIGPGNVLLDAWTDQHLNQRYDKNGEWAATGKVNPSLLDTLLNDSFFKLPHPKSTGREYFNLSWLKQYLTHPITPQDVQTTLVELTAKTIINTVTHFFTTGKILICGGGAYNHFLMKRLTALAENFHVDTTQKFGIDPDWVEAMAFAWLAKQRIEGKPGNIPAVSGARSPAILGGIYF